MHTPMGSLDSKFFNLAALEFGLDVGVGLIAIDNRPKPKEELHCEDDHRYILSDVKDMLPFRCLKIWLRPAGRKPVTLELELTKTTTADKTYDKMNVPMLTKIRSRMKRSKIRPPGV